jgi:type I restriction enzyme R subunit
MATKLLSDEVTREVFLGVVYEMLKNDISGGLISTARAEKI